MKDTKIYFPLFFFLLSNLSLKAQYEITSLSGDMYVAQGEEVWVRGAGGIELYGNSIIDNRGTIYITGNWKNDATTTGFVGNRPTGTLFLDGADQRILGARSTVFNNLTLAGTGVKFLDTDCANENILTLNDREFRLGTSKFTVRNPSVNAITRSVGFDDNSLSGFISARNGGYLARQMNSIDDYYFPMGDIVEGSPRYRPVIIRPSTSNSHRYGVRMANVDATTEGYNRGSKDTTICIVNPDFYHQIFRLEGSDSADVAFAFDNNADAIKQFMARWDGSMWRQIIPSVPVNTPGVLSYMNIFAWNDFSKNAFAMANKAAYANIISVNPPAPLVGIPVQFQAGPYPGQTYTWDFGDGTTYTDVTGNAVHTYTQPGIYIIKLYVRNEEGCEDVDEYKIEIPKTRRIYDPTGVTPNEDGVNDVFEIPFIGYDVARMSIFDRWGLLIREIETTTSPIIWDCKDKNGEYVPEDAYVYRIDATTPDGKVDTIVRTVTVIR